MVCMGYRNSNMLTLEEQQHKDEIVSLTEQVLDKAKTSLIHTQ